MIVLYGNLRLWLNTRDFIPSPGLGLILFNTYGGFFMVSDMAFAFTRLSWGSIFAGAFSAMGVWIVMWASK